MEMRKPSHQMEDPNDIGLKSVMGDRFEDCSARIRPEGTAAEPGEAHGALKAEKPRDAKWEPVRGPKSSLERLEASCKAMLPYSAACVALWVWQINGALDVGVSQVASTLCAVIAAVAATSAWCKP